MRPLRMRDLGIILVLVLSTLAWSGDSDLKLELESNVRTLRLGQKTTLRLRIVGAGVRRPATLRRSRICRAPTPAWPSKKATSVPDAAGAAEPPMTQPGGTNRRRRRSRRSAIEPLRADEDEGATGLACPA